MRVHLNALFLVLLLTATGAQGAVGRDFLCNDSPLDLFPDELFNCEAMQNFRKGFDSHALELFKRASLWGSKSAQYKVGLMYLGGYGAKIDPIEGTAWLLLANERNRFRVTESLADAMRQLSTYELGLARSRALELREKYGDLHALKRRATWVRRIKRTATGSRLGKPMASVRVVGGLGLTGDQQMARLDAYESQLREIVTTVEYRDFKVIDDD